MNKAWPLATIGEVLQLQRRWLRLEPDQLYTEIGVRSFGKGIFRKNPASRSEILSLMYGQADRTTAV